MNKPTLTMAQQVAEAASVFQLARTGYAPKAVTVVLSDDTLVVTLHEALSPAEKVLAQTPEPGFENVLLVAATGHPEESIRYLMQDAGFDAYLAKPYGADEVLRLASQGRAKDSNETTNSGARREKVSVDSV